MRLKTAEKILSNEINKAAQDLKKAIRGLTIGDQIRLFRNQLRMSQAVLAKRAKVPQSTISRVEQGHSDVTLSTLQKILNAMSCELVMAPFFEKSAESIQYNQARMVAEKHVRYLQGTMNLEQQQPDEVFAEELIKEVTHSLLEGPQYKLWEE